MKALVAGFEPFGGEPINPATEAMSRLRPHLGPLEVTSVVVPTVFGRSLEVLEARMAETRPDIVLIVGLAGGRAQLSLERIAINIDDARIADNSGQQPIDCPVAANGPAAYFSTLPIKAAVSALRYAGLPAAISNTAGTFVCNHLFYGLMHLAATTRSCRGGLLHVPYMPEQIARHAGEPSMALDHIVQGIEIVLAVSAERTADLAVPEGTLS